jgi:hypothetical protein
MYVPSPKIYKAGEPVIYYGVGGPRRLYMGGKIGAYRVLSNTPNCDSGICVEIAQLEAEVFPAPSENGLFSPSLCAQITYALDRNYKVTVSYLRAGPDQWCMAVTELCFGHFGMHSPISSRFAQPTFEGAARDELMPLLKRLGEMAAGVGRDLATSVPKSAHSKAKTFARNAILAIVAALPRHLASDILKSLTNNQ